MSWSSYLVVVLVVVLAPGVDLLMALRSTVVGGRRAGLATTLGIGTASAVQGALVSVGVGTLIVRSQPVFLALKWAGVAYLVFLGGQSLWLAVRGHGAEPDGETAAGWVRGLRQGFVCNITNPKMLVFYLSLLPQFVEPRAPVGDWLVHAWALPVLGSVWLVLVVLLASTVRDRLLRPLVRRVIDAVSGLALLGFGARLAQDH